jgi:hypothetical protein
VTATNLQAVAGDFFAGDIDDADNIAVATIVPAAIC